MTAIQILATMSDDELKSELGFYKSGHVRFTPASLWDVITRKDDPIRPGKKSNLDATGELMDGKAEKLQLYHLAFAGRKIAENSLLKLGKLDPGFVVVNYPPYDGKKLYGSYQKEVTQTVFGEFDPMTIEQIIDAQLPVMWDLNHAYAVDRNGQQLLVGKDGNQEFKSLESLINAGLLYGIHVQIGRSLKQGGASSPYGQDELKAVVNQKKPEDFRTGDLIKTVKEWKPDIIFVPEVHIYDLMNAGLINPTRHKWFLDWNGIIESHKKIIEFLRAA